MSKFFEVGDKVKVLPYNQIEGKDEDPEFVEEMEKYCGMLAVIVGYDHCGDDWYFIDINKSNYSWREDWLEPAEPEFELGEELFLI